jgi:excisionase family DNA binding protein
MSAVPWVGIDDVGRNLGVSHDTVTRWIDAQGLPAHEVGRI